MTGLKGRPERPTASAPEPEQERRRATLSDSDVVKVTTRLKNGQARAMRVAAMQQNISIEDVYSDAVDAYLRGFR